MHVIAAKAVCFKEALDLVLGLCKRIVENAQALANGLMKRGFQLVSEELTITLCW